MIKLMKGKTPRKHSLHEKTAASVLLKLISDFFYQLGGHIGRNGTIAQPRAAREFNAGHDSAKTRWRRI